MTIPTQSEEIMTNESAEGVLNICGLCTLPMRHPYIVDGYLGNSAYPLQGAGPSEGRCCDVCDCMYVLPARMEGRPPEAIKAMRDRELISRYAKILMATQDGIHGDSADDNDWGRRYMQTQERLEPARVPMYVVMMNRYAKTGSILGGDE